MEESIKEYHKENEKIDYGCILPGLREKLLTISDKPTSLYAAIAFFTLSMLILFLFILSSQNINIKGNSKYI